MSWGKTKADPADVAFALWIKVRDGWTCKRCKHYYAPWINKKGLLTAGQSLQNSHFKGRGKEGTRFEPLNCDALCAGCHKYLTAQPDEHYQWQVANKGQAVVDNLILQANTYHKKDRKSELMYWTNKLKVDCGIII